MPAVRAFRCGSQTEPVRRQAHLRRVAVHLAGQVVAFVEDYQSPAIAQAVHVVVGAVISCDSDILHFIVSAADEADLFAEDLSRAGRDPLYLLRCCPSRSRNGDRYSRHRPSSERSTLRRVLLTWKSTATCQKGKLLSF